jgi:putative tricarboxylic transport membrane protein
LTTGIGVFGYLLRKVGIPLVPVILAVLLGPQMEVNLRRALSLSDGGWGILFGSPTAIVLWVLIVLGLVLPLVWALWRQGGHASVKGPTIRAR